MPLQAPTSHTTLSYDPLHCSPGLASLGSSLHIEKHRSSILEYQSFSPSFPYDIISYDNLSYNSLPLLLNFDNTSCGSLASLCSREDPFIPSGVFPIISIFPTTSRNSWWAIFCFQFVCLLHQLPWWTSFRWKLHPAAISYPRKLIATAVWSPPPSSFQTSTTCTASNETPPAPQNKLTLVVLSHRQMASVIPRFHTCSPPFPDHLSKVLTALMHSERNWFHPTYQTNLFISGASFWPVMSNDLLPFLLPALARFRFPFSTPFAAIS